jgi:hypothetical protein
MNSSLHGFRAPLIRRSLSRERKVRRKSFRGILSLLDTLHFLSAFPMTGACYSPVRAEKDQARSGTAGTAMRSISQTPLDVQIPESHLHDLKAIIRSRTPLVAIESDEEPEVLALIQQISHRLQIKGYRWTVTEGLQSFDPDHQPDQAIEKALDALGYIKTSAANALFAMLDFHPVLQDAVHVRLLKDIALAYPQQRNTVVLVSRELKLPVELRPFAGFFRLPLPTLDELRGIVYEVASD